MKFSIPSNGTPALDGIWIRAEGGELDQPLMFRLGEREDGQLVATGLLMATEHELTTRAVRIPLAGVVSTFAAVVKSEPATYKRLKAQLAGHPEWAKDRRWKAWGAKGRSVIDFVAFPLMGPDESLQDRPRVPRVQPGRRGYPDDHYRMVAREYAKAKREHPRAPIRALMAELHATEPTVHRWIRTAREKKFIKTPDEGE